MSFLGMGILEILVVLLIAFVVLGPVQMVDMSKKAGKMLGDLRRMNSGLRETLADADVDEEGSGRGAPPPVRADTYANGDGPVAFRSQGADPARSVSGEMKGPANPVDGESVKGESREDPAS